MTKKDKVIKLVEKASTDEIADIYNEGTIFSNYDIEVILNFIRSTILENIRCGESSEGYLDYLEDRLTYEELDAKKDVDAYEHDWIGGPIYLNNDEGEENP